MCDMTEAHFVSRSVTVRVLSFSRIFSQISNPEASGRDIRRGMRKPCALLEMLSLMISLAFVRSM
jgi:hypothetical protein